MDYKVKLQTNNTNLEGNNTDLQTILDTINALPEKGIDVSDVTITSGKQLLAGVTAYGASGKITGTIPTQDARTITPTTTSQIAVSSGYYTSGDVTVAGDSNLVASNIKSGVSIFGVDGSYQGSSSGDTSGDTSNEDALIDGTITEYTNDRIERIRQNAFYNCYNLTTIECHNVVTIGSFAFQTCSNLTTASFPAATTIERGAFYSCSNLTTINFPNVITIGSTAFQTCSNLTTASFPAATTIGSSAFQNCANLTTASFSNVITISGYAFCNCYNLTTISFPVATTISSIAFRSCYSLTTINFPNVITIGSTAFQTCSNLTTASFPAATTIGSSAFQKCYRLVAIYLTGSSVCKLGGSNAFSSTPIGGYSTSAGKYGSIYVPASLLTSYKAATNWSYFSSRFVGI